MLQGGFLDHQAFLDAYDQWATIDVHVLTLTGILHGKTLHSALVCPACDSLCEMGRVQSSAVHCATALLCSEPSQPPLLHQQTAQAPDCVLDVMLDACMKLKHRAGAGIKVNHI